jgi:glycosyltransferase involved in cell wall biosynthesis
MKLIIQIPCLNEAATLPDTLAALPRVVPGFDCVEWLIVDDGSIDNTSVVARAHGADHVVRLNRSQGLARAFMTGIHACLEREADVVVNTDADNQYNAADIPELVRPIIDGRAEIVVGARPIDAIQYFSPLKKLLQHLGSWVVQIVSRTKVPDATSGFRAISRNAAQQLVLFNEYTHTLETIIHAGLNNIPIVSVPIRVNRDLRPSRLVKSMPSYVRLSIGTILRIFVIYRPMLFFGTIGSLLFGVGFVLGLRFVILFLAGRGTGHVQSLILASVLLGIGFQTLLVAFVSDLLAANRKLLEEIRLATLRHSHG